MSLPPPAQRHGGGSGAPHEGRSPCSALSPPQPASALSCSWTKERRVLLVMSKAKRKWVSVRPLPSIRNFPQQYDVSAGWVPGGQRDLGLGAWGPRRA